MATTPRWVLPDEPPPIRLMNTIWADRDGVHDSLLRPVDLAAWLEAVGTVGAVGTPARVEVTGADLRRARDLRDALRRLAAVATDDRRPSAAAAIEDTARAIAVVNAAAAVPDPPRVRLCRGRVVRDPRPVGSAEALAAVAAEAIALLTDPDGPALGACPAPRCVLYFVRDHPRREWCSTACGNRARAARHYRRHRADPA